MKYRHPIFFSLLLICGIALAPPAALAGKGLGKTVSNQSTAKPGGYTGRTGSRIADPTMARPGAKAGTTKMAPSGASGARTATLPNGAATTSGQAGKITRPGAVKHHGKPMAAGTKAQNNLRANPGGYTGRTGQTSKTPSPNRGLGNTVRPGAGPSKATQGQVKRPGQTNKATVVNKGKGPANPSMESTASSVLSRQPMPMGTKHGKNLNNRGAVTGLNPATKGKPMIRVQSPTQSKFNATAGPINGTKKSGTKKSGALKNRDQQSATKAKVVKKTSQAGAGKPARSPSKITPNPTASGATNGAKFKRFERTNMNPVDVDAISLDPPYKK